MINFVKRAKVWIKKKNAKEIGLKTEWTKLGSPIPLPHSIKQRIVEEYAVNTGYNYFVETGTYLGEMIEAQLKNFRKIYSIELDEKLFNSAVQKFKNIKSVEVLWGDSSNRLKDIMDKLEEPAIFWLDGHYSGGITALGDKECPILEELTTILQTCKHDHVMLIDDARLFIGQNDYPTIEELTQFIKRRNPLSTVKLDFDMIICELKW